MFGTTNTCYSINGFSCVNKDSFHNEVSNKFLNLHLFIVHSIQSSFSVVMIFTNKNLSYLFLYFRDPVAFVWKVYVKPCVNVLQFFADPELDMTYIDVTGTSDIANGYVHYLAENLMTGAPTRGLIQLLCHLNYCKEQVRAATSRRDATDKSEAENWHQLINYLYVQ